MLEYEILANPSHKVIFEGSFDQLMKDIRGEHLMDISAGEVVSEWLYDYVSERPAL